MAVVHFQPVTCPLHVEQGFRGQTVTLTLPTAETSGKFCFLIGSAARSKQFMNDLTGLMRFDVMLLYMSLLAWWKKGKLQWMYLVLVGYIKAPITQLWSHVRAPGAVVFQMRMVLNCFAVYPLGRIGLNQGRSCNGPCILSI